MRAWTFGALALGAALAGGALAAPPAFEEADLTAKPSGASVESVIPGHLRGQNISAQVTMRCTIDAAGKARRCETLKEEPYGLGVGGAGTRLMERQGRFKPRRIDGQAVDGGQVEFTLQMWSRGLGPTLIIDQVWARTPSFEEMAAAWPADRQEETAIVVLRCAMRRSGDLGQCTPLNEADKAMAKAAQGLSERFQVRLPPGKAPRGRRADLIVSIQLINPANAGAAERLVKVPDWTVYPDTRAVQAVYPDQAAGAGVRAGRGVADCLVAADGTLTDCRMTGERPDGLGFGEAALRVAGQMKMNLWSGDGRPTTGARIRLPIEFNLAEEPVQ